MYEQVSHTALNRILDELHPELKKKELRFFYSRLGANFYSIYSLFYKLYGNRTDFHFFLKRLVETLATNYIDRPKKFKEVDKQREEDHNWFLHQRWVGMALYANGFADDLDDLLNKVDYLSDLGVNLVHILPTLKCPEGKSDGGYAVSDFRNVDPRLGNNESIEAITNALHERGSLIALDIVVNHTSDEHEWACKARENDKYYQDFYYTFDRKDIPDLFEQTMPDVFPETDPGSFSWNADMEKWVMTVFHKYQWDLNYTNPAVFIEMLKIIFFWANKGVDVLRLDAVAFLWKQIGTPSQNLEEAHILLQLFKDCTQVVAPGLLFIAEAIVAPTEVIRYFGEDAVVAKECEIAYNATFMALLWDSVATKNASVLEQGLKSLPNKLDGATWLNYLRCHDDIGFGIDDADIRNAGYDVKAHRKFLMDYFIGKFPDSNSTGLPFGQNDKTGDARISGSLASLVGLEKAFKTKNEALISLAVKHVVMLHGLIMSYGGIPLLYYGDEIGTINDYAYEEDDNKKYDSRWLHRPKINWEKALANLEKKDSVESRIFSSLKQMIKIRKQTPAFADFNNRDIFTLNNSAIFAFSRYNVEAPIDKVIVAANMSDRPQMLPLEELGLSIFSHPDELFDLWGETHPIIEKNLLIFTPFQFYWITPSQNM